MSAGGREKQTKPPLPPERDQFVMIEIETLPTDICARTTERSVIHRGPSSACHPPYIRLTYRIKPPLHPPRWKAGGPSALCVGVGVGVNVDMYICACAHHAGCMHRRQISYFSLWVFFLFLAFTSFFCPVYSSAFFPSPLPALGVSLPRSPCKKEKQKNTHT